MSRIYQALQAAGRERLVVAQRAAETIRVAAPDELEECLLAVYRRIEALLGEGQGRVVAFTGIPEGEDNSRLVNLLARTVAYRLSKHVLVFSADLRPGEDIIISSEHLREMLHAPAREVPLALNAGMREPVLVTRRMSTLELTLPLLKGAQDKDGPLSEWRKDFDLVLLDVPPMGSSPSTDILCSVADGVVLTIEAGKARWQAARDGMDQITGLGGRMLGAILNRQRYYIPDLLYRLL